MLNFFAKWCFTLTAISPAFGAAAIVAYARNQSWVAVSGWVLAGCASAILTFLLIHYIRKEVAHETKKIIEIKQADEKVLEFALAYLLPVFSGTSLDDFASSLLLTAYSLLMISLVICQGNMFQVNPVLSLAGYHFYLVTSDKKIAYLLISKKHFHRSERDIFYKKITEYILLDVEQ